MRMSGSVCVQRGKQGRKDGGREGEIERGGGEGGEEREVGGRERGWGEERE